MKKKVTLKCISHFACTGGTLISKMIGSMPNTYLLSELHPYSIRPEFKGSRFFPSDLALQARFSNIPLSKDLSIKIFLDNIHTLIEYSNDVGFDFVLRLHSHSEYCDRELYPLGEKLITILEREFNIVNVLTVRHPIDSFVSLQKNNWCHFAPNTFDEYCLRYLKFVQDHESVILRYEDFMHNSDMTIKLLCSILDVQFDSSYRDFFSLLNFSGDSGNTSGVISNVKAKKIPSKLSDIARNSYNYKKLKISLGYN